MTGLPPACAQCEMEDCPYPNDHGIGLCESGLPYWGFHGYGYAAFHLTHPDGRTRYVLLCGVCQDNGGNVGAGTLTPASLWRWIRFKLTGR